ncbi:arginine N-succinyltransferase [Mucisphaera sp.]|uniref:arginine N-succinyltransferase n=1 Tax=Mucisphaera sp. TaxID=2913024 RepID=UPI003D0D4B12
MSLILRLVQNKDLPGLLELAQQAGHGLTTLPAAEHLLAERITHSLNNTTRLFVLEDTTTRRLLGTASITPQVGTDEPWYAFHLETITHQSQGLGISQKLNVLHLIAEKNGPSEIGTLFLSPNARRAGRGRFLSLARFLYIAEHPDDFQPRTIAELRGVVDALGRSPFWDAVGHHFFAVDYTTADFRSAYDKQFIAELMPRHPIYLNLLSDEARAVVGRVHPDTLPAMHLLHKQGFKATDLIDIFDAGPVLSAETQSIKTIRDSHRLPITPANIDPQAPQWMVANTQHDFRATLTPATHTDNTLHLPQQAIDLLQLNPDDHVRATHLYTTPSETKP